MDVCVFDAIMRVLAGSCKKELAIAVNAKLNAVKNVVSDFRLAPEQL